MLPFVSIATIVCFLPLLQSERPQGANGTRGAIAQPSFVLDAGEYRVTELVERSAKFLGRNYLLRTDSAACQPDSQLIKITKRLELDKAGCEDVISQLLYYQDWVMTPLDESRGIYEWVHITGGRSQEIRQRSFYKKPEQVAARPSLYVYVTTTVDVEHVNPQLIASNFRAWWNDPRGLRQILPIGGNEGCTVFIAGMLPTVAQMVRAIAEADKGGAKAWSHTEGRLQKLEQSMLEMSKKLAELKKAPGK